MTTLIKPTVADLIAVLQQLPADFPVIIEDADTQWAITQIDVDVVNDEAVLSAHGGYENMN